MTKCYEKTTACDDRCSKVCWSTSTKRHLHLVGTSPAPARGQAPHKIKAPIYSGKAIDFQPFYDRFSEVISTHWDAYSDGDRCCILADASCEGPSPELLCSRLRHCSSSVEGEVWQDGLAAAADGLAAAAYGLAAAADGLAAAATGLAGLLPKQVVTTNPELLQQRQQQQEHSTTIITSTSRPIVSPTAPSTKTTAESSSSSVSPVPSSTIPEISDSTPPISRQFSSTAPLPTRKVYTPAKAPINLRLPSQLPAQSQLSSAHSL